MKPVTGCDERCNVIDIPADVKTKKVPVRTLLDVEGDWTEPWNRRQNGTGDNERTQKREASGKSHMSKIGIWGIENKRE